MVHEMERFIRRVTLSSGTLSFPFKTVSWIRGKLGDLERKKWDPIHVHYFTSCYFSVMRKCLWWVFLAEMQLIISLFLDIQFYLQHSSAVCILV